MVELVAEAGAERRTPESGVVGLDDGVKVEVEVEGRRRVMQAGGGAGGAAGVGETTRSELDHKVSLIELELPGGRAEVEATGE